MPVTFAWRDELEKKTQNALHRAMGNVPPPSRGLLSRSSQRGGGQGYQFDGLSDNHVSAVWLLQSCPLVYIHNHDAVSVITTVDLGSTLSYTSN